MMEDDLQPHRYSHTPYFSTQRTPLDSNIHPDIVNNCQKCMKNRSGCSQVCIIAPLFHTRYLFTLKKPTPKRNVNTSTFTLDHSVCLCWSCWGSGGRSPNCLWDKKKKKRRWPSAKLATFSRQGISGYWVDPCCVFLPGENDLQLLSAFCSWSRARMCQECRNTGQFSMSFPNVQMFKWFVWEKQH